MNKPASKEPSMDEILSSIRQIIADDDASAPRRPPVSPAATAQPVPVPRSVPPVSPPVRPAPEPLALRADQIMRDVPAVEEEPAVPSAPADFAHGDDVSGSAGMTPPPLVDPDDVAFEGEEPVVDVAHFAEEAPAPTAQAIAPVVQHPPRERSMPPPRFPSEAPRPQPSAARAAPMPDPTLSTDMAEQLLAPATDAAVKHTFTKLSGLSAVASAVTLEALMRDMLRPMLKEWLDENLPAVVERMVEKEISRISRGGE